MKKILTFIIALVISGLGLNAQNFDVIDSELQMMLSQKSNEPISINIILDSQFDADKLNNIDNKSEKREYVISELKKFSSENQNKVMAYLQAEEGNNVTNLKSHWLVNTISCTATRDVIYKTSELSGISLIAHNGKEKLIGDYKPVKAQMQRSLIQNVTTVGADQVWAEGYTGKDVIVAVLDSGINSEHVDLKDHLWDGGAEYPDHGWNFIDNNSNTDDHNGHGTHCAGTICGDGTSGTQTGMAPDATLMGIKVLDDNGEGTLEALVSGVEFAVEHGADILSISLGWTYPDSYVSGIMREMFGNVMYAGVVASVAAGNERDGIDTIPIPYNISAPGNCPPPWLHPDQQANAGGLSAVVSVGAVDYYDEPAYFSSEGPVTWQGSQWHDYLLNLDVEIDENWLHYDNGIFETSIGGPVSFYWGVMFPAATLQQHGGDMLSKVAVYDLNADTPELLVYYGGDYAPEVLVHTQTFELTGSKSFVEIDLTSYLPIDMNQNLWIVLSTNNGINYPAAVCSDSGDPNGRWLSMDGTTWEDIVDYGLEYTWMIRAFVSDESGSAVAELKSIDDYEYKSSKGKLSALKADSKRAGAASNDSNFGLIRPDVSAPGVDIVSAAYDDNDGFYSYSGTSMATPCVAGVMALMLDKNPDLTPADICRILETTATPLDYKKSNRTGSGRINAYDACEMIEEVEMPEQGDWLYYDNGFYESAYGNLTSDGTYTPTQIFWAIMFPADAMSDYANRTISKVALYDNCAHKGAFSIHFGGDNAPGEMVHIQSYETKGEKQYVEFELDKSIKISGNDNIWIQFSNEYGSGDYPAAYSKDMGDPNSRWISNNGSFWYDNSYFGEGWYGTWMIRAYVDNQEGTSTPSQSLLFSYEDNLIEPTTINITRELNSSMEIQFDLEVTNNTDNPVNIVCEIEDNSGIGSNYVCWGSCYAPGMYNVVNTLDAFSTSMFNGHCMFVDENWNELPKGTVIPMKYTFYDENNPSEKYTFNVNFKYDTPQQQYRNVLIEEFTGRNCLYCPDGHKVANQIAANNPGRVFPINIHAGAYSPTTYPNLITTDGEIILNGFNVAGFPSGNINRNSGSAIYRDVWQTQTAEQLSQLAEVNIDGKVVINPDTRVAEITVELEYTSSSAYNTNYLTIMMLQDNIIGSQQGSSYNPEQIVDGQYRHMHVLRDVITSTWGDAVSPATAGTHITKKYIYNIPEIIGDPNGVEVDLDNIYFLAFVAETYQGTPTRPILNVDKLENVIDGETPELPHYWTPDPSLYANNMTVIATIAIDGVEQYNTDLELGAFCNGELRGAERLQETAGNYECFLMIYGDSGDNITFKLYDHASGSILDLKSNQSLTFEANATIGDVFDPYVVNFTNTVVHSQALTSGWNWYSTYIVNEGADGLANLENAIGTSGIQIKNQSKFVNQAGGNWYGTLTSTAVEDMYMIQLSSATNVALEGYEVNPADYPITLGTNWKWISYPVSASISVEEAFASANPSNGDYVKSQTGFAQYYDGLGWSGTLKTMTPGMGYMYQNKSGYAKTLVYPTPNNKSASASESESINHWTADYSKYPMNMTMIAVVEGAESAYEVAAFVDGECRGSARPIYVEALDSYIMFMTISGEDNETLTFKYYDVETGETYAITDEFTFSVNATVGDVMNPYVMTRGTLGIDDLSSSIDIYPNPVENELFLATEVRVEEIVIYDIYGRLCCRDASNASTSNSMDTFNVSVQDLEAGVYFVNIKTENGNVVKRFVKK